MHLRPPHPLDAQVVAVLLALVVVGLAWLVQDSRLTYGEALTLFAPVAAAANAWLWGARGGGRAVLIQALAAAAAWGLTTLLLAGLAVVTGW